MQWILLCLASLVAAWTASELEIFRLQDAIIKDLKDPKATFYSWLGVKKGAKLGSINKAYRKLSQTLHPDKNPIDGAQERFSRLGLVHKVLRSSNRDTYDFYLGHGFPKLNAEGQYVFNRWSPNLLISVVFVLVLVTAVHFALLYVGALRRRQFFQNIIDEAFELASTNGVVHSKRTVTLGNGRRAEVHPDGTVLIDGSKVSVDIVPEAKITDTVLFRLIPTGKSKKN